MCYTCGCKMPYEDHGDSANIIESHFDKAGQTDAIKNGGKKSAKENTLELLQIISDKGEVDNPQKQYD